MSMTLHKLVLQKYLADVFVETGTFDGRGAVFAVYAGFKEVHTIEVDLERARTAKFRFSGFPEVTLHAGDSVDILPKILGALEKKALIFLDSHPIGLGDPSKGGRIKYPLLEELRILKECSRRQDHSVLIDDLNAFNYFGTSVEDVKARLLAVNPKYAIKIEPNCVGQPDMVGAKV